jgi:hypothetical protein
MRDSRFTMGIVVLSLAALAGGCKRGQTPPPQVESTAGTQQKAEPVTIVGCLRSGALADASWVLMTDPSNTGGTHEAPATYQLTGGDQALLRENVGRQIEVTGTVNAEQEVASRSEAVERRAKGTTGTPTVDTKTDVDIRRLTVSSVKPTGSRCK